MPGMLYLVPTPIGNLGDISERCRQTLADADFIAAEDTRVSLKLLNHLELKKPLVSYYEHNRAESGQRILERLLAGETCALVSDAGSPAISDPGEDLVRLCAENGVTVCAIPGLLTMNKKNRREHLESLKDEQRTMIFYEAPHKLLATLSDFSAAFGGSRRISLCRELTKLHEEIYRTTINEALAHYQSQPPRGEFVLVVEGAQPPEVPEYTLEDAVSMVLAQMEAGLSRKDAARAVAAQTGFSKNTLYDAALSK